MKRNELYRSIDSIKQDKSLKNRVMNAVETKDRIVVHKRPFFIPAAAAVLLAVNIAFVGSLMFDNETQERWKGNNMDGVIQTNMSSQKNSGFEDYAEMVYKEITEHTYYSVSFTADYTYAPQNDNPWFDIYDYSDLKNGTADKALEYEGDRQYVRYIQYEGDFLTNHEYIIGYDGNGEKRENIINITESNVEYNHNEIRDESSEYNNNLHETLEKEVYAKSDEYGYYNYKVEDKPDCKIHLFQTPFSDSNTFYKYRVWLSLTDDIPDSQSYNESYSYDYIILDSDSNIYYSIGGVCDAINDYWKPSYSREDYRYAVLPELPQKVSTNVNDVRMLLSGSGFENVTVKYSNQTDDMNDYGQVAVYGNDLYAGLNVKTDSHIEVTIYRSTMPGLVGLSPNDAETILINRGINYTFKYITGSDENDYAQGEAIVDSTIPEVGSPVSGSDRVIIYVNLPDDAESDYDEAD